MKTKIDGSVTMKTAINDKILFVCTGNYYRSRYAELYFNRLASKLSLNWSAFSRGLATGLNSQNIGPIYPQVLKRLKEHDITIEGNMRPPIQLEEIDLKEAELIIALHEEEHRPIMQHLFAEWANRVTYWQIPDLD